MEAMMLRRGGGVFGVADSGMVAAAAPILPGPRFVQVCVKRRVSVAAPTGCVRVMGIGGRKEGDRGWYVVKAAAREGGDGIAPENGESRAREQIVEQAKTESASTIDDEQEPFRDAVESGQTIGEATTALQFEENDGKEQSSSQQAKMNGPPKKDKDEGKAEEEEVSSEVWGSRDEDGNTHAFLDDSKKVDFQGEDDASVLGIGGQRASDSPM